MKSLLQLGSFSGKNQKENNHVATYYPAQSDLGFGFPLLGFFRAGTKVWKHEVSPEECGPSLPLLL